MRRRGFTYAGRPSIRRLTDAVQDATGRDYPSVSTVHKLVLGQTATPEDTTVNAAAAALGVDARTVTAWSGQVREVSKPCDPPEGCDRLSQKQCGALDMLIRVMIDREEGEGPNSEPPAGGAGGVVQFPERDPSPPQDAAADEGPAQPGFDSQDPVDQDKA